MNGQYFSAGESSPAFLIRVSSHGYGMTYRELGCFHPECADVMFVLSSRRGRYDGDNNDDQGGYRDGPGRYEGV